MYFYAGFATLDHNVFLTCTNYIDCQSNQSINLLLIPLNMGFFQKKKRRKQTWMRVFLAKKGFCKDIAYTPFISCKVFFFTHLTIFAVLSMKCFLFLCAMFSFFRFYYFLCIVRPVDNWIELCTTSFIMKDIQQLYPLENIFMSVKKKIWLQVLVLEILY